MFKEVQLSDIEQDGLLHSRVEGFMFNSDKKNCILQINFIRLKIEGSFYSCKISISGWWNFEVYEYNKREIVRHFSLDNIPELNQVLDFSFHNDELIFTGIGLHKDTAIDYKFVKPKIQITGEYDPD